MSLSMKRNIGSKGCEPSSTDAVNNKRRCTAPVASPRRCATVSSAPMTTTGKFCAYKAHNSFDLSSSASSSEDDDDDEEDADGMIGNTSVTSSAGSRTRSQTRLRSIRFANMVKVAPVDSTLSRAVAQYSDDDEDEDDNENDDVGYGNFSVDHDGSDEHNSESSFMRYRGRSISPHTRKSHSNSSDDDDSDKTVSRFSTVNSAASSHYSNDVLKKRCQSSNAILNANYSNGRGLLNNKRYSVNIADVVGSLPSANASMNHNNNDMKFMTRSHSAGLHSFSHMGNIPSSDFVARSRCFEYLVGAIDEAWARYCDSTSRDEDIAYGDGHDDLEIGDVRGSIANCDNSYGQNNVALTPSSNIYSTDDEAGYKSNFSETTSVTEYDSDFNNKRNNGNKFRSFSMINNTLNTPVSNSHKRRVSEVPENLRLQGLKDRFTKAKYYLEDLVDSDALEDCFAFWTKWDLVKYSIVDFVEEDEEDDDIERRIDELEVGRFAIQ